MTLGNCDRSDVLHSCLFSDSRWRLWGRLSPVCLPRLDTLHLAFDGYQCQMLGPCIENRSGCVHGRSKAIDAVRVDAHRDGGDRRARYRVVR
jgi:hypothetical protein